MTSSRSASIVWISARTRSASLCFAWISARVAGPVAADARAAAAPCGGRGGGGGGAGGRGEPSGKGEGGPRRDVDLGGCTRIARRVEATTHVASIVIATHVS